MNPSKRKGAQGARGTSSTSRWSSSGVQAVAGTLVRAAPAKDATPEKTKEAEVFGRFSAYENDNPGAGGWKLERWD